MSELDYGNSSVATAASPTSTNTPPIVPNAASDTFDVRISRVTRASMQDVPSLDKISDEKWDEIEQWLQQCVSSAIQGRNERNQDRRRRWRNTLSGIRTTIRTRRDQSNLSVPLTIWASAAVRARVRAGTIESDPLIVVTPNPNLSVDPDTTTAARKLVTFYTAEYRNPRGLGGVIACDKAIAEFVPIGIAGKLVHIEPDRVRWVFDALAGRMTRLVVRGRVRHAYIAADDLIYPLGFGTDVQAMPFAGYQCQWTWQDLLAMRESGYMDKDAVESVKGQGDSHALSSTGADGSAARTSIGAEVHVAYETHPCDEVYFDYPLFDDGLPVALCAYRQTARGVLLGLRYSYAPRGIKPLWLYNFDTNPDPTNPEGQGVCEKLGGVQDETDLVHNLGIESAKRAIAHVIVLREGSGAEEEFGGDIPILPGDHIVTERVDEDVKPIPLGSPEGMQAALAQEANSLRYVMRLLGLDESALGNVESGKRVPASLGLEIKKDSRVITSHAIANFGAIETEVTYFTLEMLRLRLPEDTLIAAVGPDGARLLKTAVFSANDVDLRSRYIINFNATDAAATEASRTQQLLTLGQYLQGVYDRIIQYSQMAATLPPPLQQALLGVMEKMLNGTRALLDTIDTIHNPDELLPKVADLAAALESMAPPPAAQGAAQ